jgi:leucyl-tRNA synthetase
MTSGMYADGTGQQTLPCAAATVTSLVQGKGSVYLMAATLRPETMYGQTNCWVLPDGEYGAYAGPDGDVYVMAPRSARNLLWQVSKQVDEEIMLDLANDVAHIHRKGV